jgi:hypothetical protein
MTIKSIIGTACTCLAIVSFNANAYVFQVDNFSVSKNESVFFNDSFDDGSPPPSAPNFSNGNPASYFVKGAMGPETGGKLTLDSADADPGLSSLGTPLLFQAATLLTSTDSSDLTSGMKINNTLLIQAIFDLAMPSVTMESYGINFSDRATNIGLEGDDIVGVRAINTLGGVKVQFFETSFVDSTFNSIDSILLEAGHDQIMFNLMRADTNTNAVTASFAYIDGGSVGATQSLSGSADIFNGENWTRAQFLSRTVVPVPAAVWLFGSGLIGLIGLARRKA